MHQFLVSRSEPLVLVYHNITPGHFFEPYDTVFADLLALGRHEVERLLPHVVCAIADSNYNAAELETMGYRNVRVVPPVVNTYRLSKVKPRQSTMEHLAAFQGADPLVGRPTDAAQAPRLPRQDDARRRDLSRDARLPHVGGPPTTQTGTHTTNPGSGSRSSISPGYTSWVRSTRPIFAAMLRPGDGVRHGE